MPHSTHLIQLWRLIYFQVPAGCRWNCACPRLAGQHAPARKRHASDGGIRLARWKLQQSRLHIIRAVPARPSAFVRVSCLQHARTDPQFDLPDTHRQHRPHARIHLGPRRVAVHEARPLPGERLQSHGLDRNGESLSLSYPIFSRVASTLNIYVAHRQCFVSDLGV
jgi:hypothetical protein